jgi:hypothetical protein
MAIPENRPPGFQTRRFSQQIGENGMVSQAAPGSIRTFFPKDCPDFRANSIAIGNSIFQENL